MRETETNTAFELGEVVYLITDEDQSPYMIIGITFTLDEGHYYILENEERNINAYERQLQNVKGFYL